MKVTLVIWDLSYFSLQFLILCFRTLYFIIKSKNCVKIVIANDKQKSNIASLSNHPRSSSLYLSKCEQEQSATAQRVESRKI